MDKKVKDDKMESVQEQLPQVECEGVKLENAAWFKYLGSIFATDGSQRHDVKRRIGLVMSRCGSLRHVFDSKDLNLDLKLTIINRQSHH